MKEDIVPSRPAWERPSPGLVVAVIALVVGVSGVAWAAVKIDTEDLRRAAVTSKKLHSRAVTSGKLAKDAVTVRNIADFAVGDEQLRPNIFGVALAGVNVSGDGRVDSWFNRRGGAPTVEHVDTGIYELSVPGYAPAPEVGSAVLQATITDLNGGQIAADAWTDSASDSHLRVRTWDRAGMPADRPFSFAMIAGRR